MLYLLICKIWIRSNRLFPGPGGVKNYCDWGLYADIILRNCLPSHNQWMLKTSQNSDNNQWRIDHRLPDRATNLKMSWYFNFVTLRLLRILISDYVTMLSREHSQCGIFHVQQQLVWEWERCSDVTDYNLGLPPGSRQLLRMLGLRDCT